MFGSQLQLDSFLLAVRLQSLSLKVLWHLRYKKSDWIVDPAGATEECFAPCKFHNLFDRAIGSRRMAVLDQAMGSFLINSTTRNLLQRLNDFSVI